VSDFIYIQEEAAMSLNRREFMQLLAAASFAGMPLNRFAQANTAATDLYDFPSFGNVALLHYTDCHAQLLPTYYREPSINLGVAGMKNHIPHLVGQHYLDHYDLTADSRASYALTYLDFVNAAERYGKVGGFAHLKTLVDQLRANRPGALLLDGGDTWQGSWTALQSQAQDMVQAQLALGVDVMTPHWEMTYGAARVQEIVNKDFAGHIDFIAQNIVDKDFEDLVFKPYVIREINQVPVAIIGQAFPYTPIAHPSHFTPDWRFGIRDEQMQSMVDEAREAGAQVVVLLSHNGMDVDLKLASRVTGIDVIMGGHTHDAVLQPVVVDNAGGQTLVSNAGSNGKFLAVLDLDVREGKVRDYRYKLLPVFADLIKPDKAMQNLIHEVREPYQAQLAEELAFSDELLYRRGNFNGTFDQVICNALMESLDTPIALSPGFRWGTTVLTGQTITFEHVAEQTAITYGTVTRTDMTGDNIKTILEAIADNLFNPDPYYQQGGDMVRVGGLQFKLDPSADTGQRISGLQLGEQSIDPKKTYPVAGWASVQENVPDNQQIWEVVADYLRAQKTVATVKPNVPALSNISDNHGIALDTNK